MGRGVWGFPSGYAPRCVRVNAAPGGVLALWIQLSCRDFDADADGKLSREEAPVLIREQLECCDTDHDGFITLQDAQRWD